MKPKSLLNAGRYSSDWVRDFYDQTGIWWGPDSEIPEEDLVRAAAIERFCGPGPKCVLELGCGSGHTALATASCGHSVIGVDLSPRRIQQAQELLNVPHGGALAFQEGDYYTVDLPGKFDAVTCWDGFGVNSDVDHRRLLRRIAKEWLAPGGCALIEVASPMWVIPRAGTEERLDPLPGVPGSVEMIRRCRFDPLHSRWIDEWQPAADPENALAQTIRCYSPADFLLLLEGTGLAMQRLEVAGAEVDFRSDRIVTSGPLVDAYSYLVQLVAG
jgi:hypothetical protein